MLASKRKIKWGRDAIKGEGNPNFSGGRYLDDKGYLRVLMPEHPHQNHGYVYMHRIIVERFLGRHLKSGEIIHHINCIKLDNRIGNLFITSVEEHSLIHKEGSRMKKENRKKQSQRAKNFKRQRDSSGKYKS